VLLGGAQRPEGAGRVTGEEPRAPEQVLRGGGSRVEAERLAQCALRGRSVAAAEGGAPALVVAGPRRGVDARRERREEGGLVRLVARHRADEHRHAGLAVAREERPEVGAELGEAARVGLRSARHALVAGHELHDRARRVVVHDRARTASRGRARGAPQSADGAGHELHRVQPADRQVGAHQRARAAQRPWRCGTERAVPLVVPGVDEHRVGARGEYRVRLVEERVRVDRGERGVDDLDVAVGKRRLEPLLEHARRGAVAQVRKALRGGLPLEDHAERAGRLHRAQEVEVWRGEEGTARKEAARVCLVQAQVPGTLRDRNEQRLRARDPCRAQPELDEAQQRDGGGQRERGEEPPARRGQRRRRSGGAFTARCGGLRGWRAGGGAGGGGGRHREVARSARSQSTRAARAAAARAAAARRPRGGAPGGPKSIPARRPVRPAAWRERPVSSPGSGARSGSGCARAA
jgi:hypothetical protein